MGKVPTSHIEATTSSRLAFVIRVYAVEPSGGHDSTLKAFEHEIQGNTSSG